MALVCVRVVPCGTLQGPGMADMSPEKESTRAVALATVDVRRIA